MSLDTTGLDSRVFEAFAETSKSRYIYLCNLQTNVSRWSKSAVEYFGLPGEYVENMDTRWVEYIHPDDRSIYEEDITAVFSGKKDSHNVEYRARNKEGKYVLCTCNGVVLKGKDGEPDYFAGTLENHGIIDNVDPVTNLYNHYEFNQKIRLMRDLKEPALIMVVGILDFGNINMIYDYVFGNKVLYAFASKMRELVGGGQVFRLDGVKFAICMRDADEKQAEELYQQIKKIAHKKLVIEDNPVSFSVAAGAFLMRNFSVTSNSIQACVMHALDLSKRENHGQLTFFNNEQGDEDKKLVSLMADMHRCILEDCDGFYLCYQPIVDAKTGRICGMESLIRWEYMPYGLVPPNNFIPWLEQDPRFFILGDWILRQSMQDAKMIQEQIPDFFVHVNISYTQMERKEFRESVLNILNQTGFPPKNLVLELTERCRSLNMTYLAGEMEFFRSLGIQIALDDFGIQGSSLELLFKLPINHLKLDRSFIMNIQTDPISQAVVEAVLNCAKRLHICTCIEGVEDEQLRQYLQSYPAKYHQGYTYARPMRLEKLLDMLRERGQMK